MELVILCDQRTKEDQILGKKGGIGWNERPYYLINKIFQDPDIKPVYKELNELCGADLKKMAFLHLDKTVHSEKENCVIDNLFKETLIFNKYLRDVTKKNVERMLSNLGILELRLSEKDPYQGKVIIKSNFNAGDCPKLEYRVINKSEVDEEDWKNEEIIIQRFVSSGKDGSRLKRMDRYIIFLGEVVYCSFFSKENIIKRDTSVWEYYRDVSRLEDDLKDVQNVCLNEEEAFYKRLSSQEIINQQKITHLCRLLGLDFGSIDTITDQAGNFYILDVNKTPWERGIPRHFIKIFRKRLKDRFQSTMEKND